MGTRRSHQACLLCGIRHGNMDIEDYLDRFLDAAEEDVFGEVAVLFNAGLRDPLSRAEMRSLRPLDFDVVWRYVMNRPESRVSTQHSHPSPLAAIQEGQTLQIGVMGIATPLSSPPATSPPVNLGGKRGRLYLVSSVYPLDNIMTKGVQGCSWMAGLDITEQRIVLEENVDAIWSSMYYDSRYVIRENGQILIIPNVKDSDNGEYCCTANNGVGEPAKSCGALQLKMKPEIKRHPTNVTLLLESKAVLPCVALGYPKPEITWIKDEDLIKVNSRISVLEYGALKINNIKKEDAGQYRCVARNSFGIAYSRPVTLEVQAPAKILKVPKEKKVQIGSEVALECNATGNPIPSITWLENGNTISGASVEEIIVGNVIVSILRVVVHKPALYTCQATNQHSGGINTVKATAKVTVSGKT
ncbi:muscle, skeletal receptor tyrosine-protein kinase-like [Triplophysa rosa]|uniref:muscle, skeletal receptor tyrosine-protein kinase-like n=1 Tax=Triplophysa rosa TaxID=992332 RepID=UPI002545E213|nr:muscle, skeletal receptor tyrosine-protein kinase-like [Triplophysa rosa]